MIQLCPRGVIAEPIQHTFRLFIHSLSELSELAEKEKAGYT